MEAGFYSNTGRVIGFFMVKQHTCTSPLVPGWRWWTGGWGVGAGIRGAGDGGKGGRGKGKRGWGTGK